MMLKQFGDWDDFDLSQQLPGSSYSATQLFSARFSEAIPEKLPRAIKQTDAGRLSSSRSFHPVLSLRIEAIKLGPCPT